MIPRIKHITPMPGYNLYAEFDDGRKVESPIASSFLAIALAFLSSPMYSA